MKKLYLLLSLLFYISAAKVSAQALPANQPGQNPCAPLGLCNGFFSSSAHYTGIGTSPFSVGCLYPSNCVWIQITVTTPGTIVFTITPNNQYDDYDFAVVNITNSSCSTFNSNNVIRCNGNSNYTSTTAGALGLNTTSTLTVVPGGTPGNPWLQQITANAGDVYLVCIDWSGNYANPSSTASGFTFDMAGSTALPTYSKPAFTTLDSSCDKSMSLKVHLNKPVKCSSIAANGSDFTVSPLGTVSSAAGTGCTPGGFTSEITVHFTTPLAPGGYLLGAQNGTDGNTLLDACDSALVIPASLPFTISPSNIQMIKLDTPACNKARIILNEKIRCNTVAANGSDFVVSGPSAVSVTSAVPYHCVNGWADTIDLFFNGSIPVAGTYTLSVVVGTDTNSVTDSCGHAITNQIQWTVSDRGYVTATVTPDIICNPDYVDLLSTVDIPAPVEGYSAKWSPGFLVGDSTSANTTAYINTAFNTFQIQITDSSHCYRRDTASVLLSIRNPQILATLSDTAFCVGYSIQLAASGGVGYTWSPADGLSCTTCADPIAKPSTTTTYTATISDIYGCSDDLSRTITIYALPEVSAGSDTTVEYHTPVQLYANAPAGVYYYWEPIAGLNDPNIANPIAMPEITTVYTVRIADTNRCQSYDSVTVFLINNKPVAMPNAFSPNGDGRNDVFRLTNISYQTLLEFQVYDRWGKVVFETTDIKTGWDGSYKGEQQPIGSYYYIIRVQSPDNGKTSSFKGSVTLLR